MATATVPTDTFDNSDTKLRQSREALFNAVANLTRMLLVLRPKAPDRRVLVLMRSSYEEQIQILNEIIGDEINHGPYRCPRAAQTLHPEAQEAEAT